MCAEQIPADALLCPYCGTRFGEEVQAAPPPAEPVQLVSPVLLPARKNRTGLWIAGALALVVILCGVIATLLWTQRLSLPAFSGLLATPTPSATPTPPPTLTPTLTPTIALTRTPRPTPTATHIPAWVTDFAQPILDAIADRPPSFQDDFGSESAGWQADDWCGRRMKYVEGELVVTDCRVSRPNINYSDFVIEFDARFFPGAASGSDWSLHFRDIGGPSHSIRIYYGGDVMLSFNEGGTYDFPGAANPVNQSNHILVIGKGSRMAVFLNGEPLFSVDAPLPQYGDFRFFADGTILAIDNLKIWNIYDLP
jgi:hypothetical protein